MKHSSPHKPQLSGNSTIPYHNTIPMATYPSNPTIGWCGLGAMGMGMATHLISRGYDVTGYDTNPTALNNFAAKGGTAAPSLRESAMDKDFYIVMVASKRQVQPILFHDETGIVEVLPPNATLIVCSTVPSEYIRGVEAQLRSVGRADVDLIDAPVSGGSARAANGTLTIMAGASNAAFAKGQWVLEVMSAPQKLFIVAGGIGAGSHMKMAHQVLASAHILATSEVYGFAARMGLNGHDVYNAVRASEGASWMFQHRSERTLSEDYNPGVSAVTIILKDTSIITTSARSEFFPATLCSAAEQVYFTALDRGFGGQDDSGLVRLWTPQPVASIVTSLTPENKAEALKLVVDLLIGIHLVAAAEAIGLARHVGIDLNQFYGLVRDAAGASHTFIRIGRKMIDLLHGDPMASGIVFGGYMDDLIRVMNKAEDIKCPLYMGSAALNVLLATGPQQQIEDLMEYYRVR